MYALDIETAPLEQTTNPYALEPYRYGKKATITSVSIASAEAPTSVIHLKDGSISKLRDTLVSLSGKKVYAHNAIFDCAWLIAAFGYDLVKSIRWHDTMLLAKWIENRQISYKSEGEGESEDVGRSLSALVGRYISDDHPDKAEFLDLKLSNVKPGEDYDYWLRRNKLDAMFTLELAKLLERKLDAAQLNQYRVEQMCIPVLADSWVRGIYYDRNAAAEITPKVTRAQNSLAAQLGTTKTVLNSSTQLGKLLFDTWGFQPISTTKRGGSTKKEDLIELYHRTYDQRLKAVLDFKQLSTLQSKFIDAFENIYQYNGENIAHATPRLFGTYTGRMTYSAKTKKVFPSGFAVHQIPRKGPTRKLMTAPPGYLVAELDAAGQEMRFMGIIANDEVILNGCRVGIDMHSDMASYISGKSYEEFQRLYHAEDPESLNERYAGKLLNLSCQYRTSAKTVKKKFLSTYNIIISDSKAMSYVSMYASRYKGVKHYWKSAPIKAIENGYASTLGNRRYAISEWSTKKWVCESSAINFPIQGSGADQKEIAIATLARKLPEMRFAMDLHDGLWYYIPIDRAEEILSEARDILSQLSYHRIWGVEMPIPLPFDAKLGTSFGTVKELK